MFLASITAQLAFHPSTALIRWQFLEHLDDLAGCSINFVDELLEAGDLPLHICLASEAW